MKKIRFNGLNEYIYVHKLKNGLDVYMVPNINVKNFYITYNVKFGSLYTEFKKENDSKYIKTPDGVAHFLEHLTFKMDGADASDYFSSIGSSSNAYTSFKITGYEVLGHTNFKDNLKYLLKFVNEPYYTLENVTNEKGIISEEVKTSKDNPYNQVYFGLNRCLFKNDKRRNLVCGEVEDVKKITKEDILNAYNYFYNPSNMFIIITGNFNQDEAVSIIEEELKKYNKKSFNVSIKNLKEPSIVNEKNRIEKANIETNKVSVGFKIPVNTFKNIDLSKLELSISLSLILNSNFGYSSLLKEELLNGNVINYPFSIDKYFANDLLIFSFCTETEYPNRVIDIIREKINNLELSLEDFDRKKKVFISNFIQSFDDIETVNDSISEDIIEFGKLNNDLYEVYNKLDYDKCLKVMKKLNSNNMSSFILTKEDG